MTEYWDENISLKIFFFYSILITFLLLIFYKQNFYGFKGTL